MSLRKDIDISKTIKLGKFETELGKSVLRVAVNKGLEKAAKQAAMVLAGKTYTAPPAQPGGSNNRAVATGALMKAWEIIPDRPTMTIAILNKKIYSPYVEKGVKAGQSKIPTWGLTLDLFEQWLKARKIVAHSPQLFMPKTGRRRGPNKDKPAPSPERRFARMIIWRINKRTGIRFEPRNIIKESTPRIREIFKARVREELERAMIREAK